MLAPARVACVARASVAPARQLRAGAHTALAASRPRVAPARALRRATAMADAAAKRVLVPIGNGSEARAPREGVRVPWHTLTC
jgi:hypothetical protein